MTYRSKASRAAQGMTRAVMRATDTTRLEALQRAESGQSFANYPAIVEGFMAMGISPDDITPRENVFTYNAWKAKGRQVRRGEHGVKIVTFVEMSKSEDDGEKTETWRHPRTTTVFHFSQTDPIEND